MNRNSEQRYLNFPIQLLKSFLIEPNQCLYNILAYSIYRHTMKLEYGDRIQVLCDSLDYFRIESEHFNDLIDDGEVIFNSMQDNSPMVGLNTYIFNAFYGKNQEKFNQLCLLAFLSIKSILGNKSYVKLCNDFWFSRMDGNPKNCKGVDLSDELKKYNNKYQARKIKDELGINWGLKTFSHARGFYATFDLTFEQLVTQAEKNRTAYKLRQKRQEENEIIKRVKSKLNV